MKKAMEIIHKMAKENGVVLGKEIQSKFEYEEELSRKKRDADGSAKGSRASSLTQDTAATSALMSSNTSVLDLLR